MPARPRTARKRSQRLQAGNYVRPPRSYAGMDTAPAQAVAKLRYTHIDMIDFILANPGVSQNALAARYGFSPAWVSQVMASDAWKSMMAARRAEIADPALTLTINERFAALAERSVEVLLQKLHAPQVSDALAVKAAELGAKAMGIGGMAPATQTPGSDHLAQLANRLIDLQSNIRQGVTLNGQSVQVAD